MSGAPPVGSFAIRPDHPCFPGHLPGQPLVPGALLLDRALAVLAARGLIGDPPGPVTVRFLLPVGPGDEVAIRCQPSRLGLSFEGHVGDRRVLAGRVGAP